MISNDNVIEKRVHRRFDVHLIDINVRPKWLPLSKGATFKIVDISEGGMKITGSTSIRVGSKSIFNLEMLGRIIVGQIKCVGIFTQPKVDANNTEQQDEEVFYCLEFIGLKAPAISVIKSYIAIINV